MGMLCALSMGFVSVACDSSESSSTTNASGVDPSGTGDDGATDGDDGATDGATDGADGSDDGSGGGETGSGSNDIEIEPGNMIDDLEDGDPLILAANGRQGAWYTYNDETKGSEQLPPTPFEPTAGGPGTSLFQAQTSGTGFTTWGAGVGVDLNNEGDPDGGDGIRMPYDASAHQGIVFHARGTVPIRVKLLVEGVVAVDAGGTCEDECDDAHGKIVPLTDEWTQYTVDFAEAFQEGWGLEATFDPATLMSVQFQVGAGMDFDYAIDQVGFY
ncbi:MAG: hypothetical protein AAF799_02700 [Myxococcota bacterium]